MGAFETVCGRRRARLDCARFCTLARHLLDRGLLSRVSIKLPLFLDQQLTLATFTRMLDLADVFAHEQLIQG